MSLVARVHKKLISQGVPVLSVRDRGGKLEAVLAVSATPAQAARAAEVCASPPAADWDELLHDSGLAPLPIALALLSSPSATADELQWATECRRAAIERARKMLAGP